MEPNWYYLRGAKGDWPNGLSAPVFDIRIIASTVEKAIASAKQRLASELSVHDIDHAWLKDDDGWTVWSTVEDGISAS